MWHALEADPADKKTTLFWTCRAQPYVTGQHTVDMLLPERIRLYDQQSRPVRDR
jgi:hypothetical protein